MALAVAVSLLVTLELTPSGHAGVQVVRVQDVQYANAANVLTLHFRRTAATTSTTVAASAPTTGPAATPPPSPAKSPSPPPVPVTSPKPAPQSYTCATALAYLASHAAPGFRFECPGYAEGHQAMTCVNVAGICPGEKLIAIAVVCPATWMNEASNSWVLTGRSNAPIDPYGYCH